MDFYYNSINISDNWEYNFTDEDRTILINPKLSMNEILEKVSIKNLYIDSGYIKKIIDGKCYIFFVEYICDNYSAHGYALTINHYKIKEINDITKPDEKLDQINEYKIEQEYYNNNKSDIGDDVEYHSEKIDKLFDTYEMAFHYRFMKLKQWEYFPNGYAGIYKYYEFNKLKYEYYHINGKINGQFYINNILYNYVDGILIDKKIYYVANENGDYPTYDSNIILKNVYTHKYLNKDTNNYIIKKYDIHGRLREQYDYIDKHQFINKRFDENENLIVEMLGDNTCRHSNTINQKLSPIGYYKQYKDNKLYIDCTFNDKHKLIGTFKKYCDEYSLECNFIPSKYEYSDSYLDGIYTEYNKDNLKVFECVLKNDNKQSHTEFYENGNKKIHIIYNYDTYFADIEEFDENSNILKKYKSKISAYKKLNTEYYIDFIKSEDIINSVSNDIIFYEDQNLTYINNNDDIDNN